MRKEVLVKKQKLLQRISKKRYVDLLRYIEKVYLSDFQLKILMARKFSNLFTALLPLVKEEYGGRTQNMYKRSFPEKDDQPVIVSNRALDMLKTEIQSGKYKKILLADDIIIHGRTLENIYRMIKGWLDEAGIMDYEIKVYAYARSEKGVLDNVEFLSNCEVEECCNTAQWREISNDIVQIFYILGTSYTSYVPNGRISMSSDAGQSLSQLLDRANTQFYRQTNVDMEMHGIESYVYMGQTDFKIGLNSTIRVYKYENEYILVPMVLFKPIEKKILWECLEELDDIIDDGYMRKLKLISDSEMVYRTAVYLVSALWGWKFVADVLKQPINVLIYDKHEEIVNFNTSILNLPNDDLKDSKKVEQLLENVNKKYREPHEIEHLIDQQHDYIELDKVFENILRDVDCSNTDNMKHILGKYLSMNGELDENRCKKDADIEERRRLIGYPMVRLASRLAKYNNEWIKYILYAIDYGKGSIVSKKIFSHDATYFLSVIHAGEQNYKYLEETYFPFLYGLYEIEFETKKRKIVYKCAEMKKEFLNRFCDYWKGENKFVLEEDIQQLQRMDVSTEFREVIISTVWDYFNKPEFNKAVEVAKEVLKTEG